MTVNQIYSFWVRHVLSKLDSIFGFVLVSRIFLLQSSFLIFLGLHELLTRLWLSCQVVWRTNWFLQCTHCLLFYSFWFLSWKWGCLGNSRFAAPILSCQKNFLLFQFLFLLHSSSLFYFVEISMHTLWLCFFALDNRLDMLVISIDVRPEEHLFLLQLF